MTPKEEAELLIFQYYDMFSIALENSIAISEAQSCALLAVKVILNADIPITDSEDADVFYDYWNQVYYEIKTYEGVQ